MDRMDEEFEEREKKRDVANESWKSASLKKELENERAIRQALDRGRGFMVMGNRKSAVQALESVSELCSWQSDLGGEVLLELGMALETVERTDDARKVYGKLASVSWSSKVRRNALQLIQGLDITKQIRKDVSPRKPAMDQANLYLVQAAIEKGLLLDNDRKRKADVAPWFDDGKGADGDRVENLRDAYKMLRRALDPLRGQKVPSSVLSQAFRRIFLVGEAEKMELLRTRGVLTSVFAVGEKPKVLNRVPGAPAGPPREGTFFAMIADSGSSVGAVGASPSSSDLPSAGDSRKSLFATMSEDPAPVSMPVAGLPAFSTTGDVFARVANGTWDLVLSLVDESPFAARRVESGDLRRVYNLKELEVAETVPTLWGLGSTTLRSKINWNKQRSEITLSAREFTRSNAPWQDKGALEKTQIVLLADEDLMVIKEPSRNPTGPDLFSLWRRATTKWNKF